MMNTSSAPDGNHSLLKSDEFFLILFPNQELARTSMNSSPDSPGRVSTGSFDLWSNFLTNGIRVIDKGECFLILEQTPDFYRILTGTGKIGWIISRELTLNFWTEVREVRTEDYATNCIKEVS